jgi:NAD(P)-dependent dehydrogenase (short-subunit alcohol dehydrogenase family)
MDRTIVLITGANTGIGFEVVKALLQSERHYHIFLCGRDYQKAEKAVETAKTECSSASSVQPIQLDVEDDESITAACKTVAEKFDKIDVLINNAGASFDQEVPKGTMTIRQAYNKAWNVNVAGAHVVTETFLPLLLRSSDPRLIFNTSGLSSLHDSSDVDNPRYTVPPAGLPKEGLSMSYRSSKAGLNMQMVEWARVLKNDGVKVWSVAPGLLATGLGGDPALLKKIGAGDPRLGGESIRGVVEGKRDADAGRVVREYGDSKVQAW